MPHGLRTHTPGAMTYLILRSIDESTIFRDEDERCEFFRRLPLTLQKTHARLHAVCLIDSDVRLLIEVAEVPLGRFVQHLCSYYSRWVHQRREESGNLFHQRYNSVTIENQSLIPNVIQHIHRSPLTARVTTDLSSYLWSSHRSYLGRDPAPWVTTQYRRDLAALSHVKRGRDTTALSQPEEFVPGDAEFVRWLTLRQRESVKPATLEQIVAATCARLRIEERDLVSASRVRYLALARAVVTWHARQAKVATLTEAAARLNRDPSTLLDGCKHYEKLYPGLFGMRIEKFVRSTPEPFNAKRARMALPFGTPGRLPLGPKSHRGPGSGLAMVRVGDRPVLVSGKSG